MSFLFDESIAVETFDCLHRDCGVECAWSPRVRRSARQWCCAARFKVSGWTIEYDMKVLAKIIMPELLAENTTKRPTQLTQWQLLVCQICWKYANLPSKLVSSWCLHVYFPIALNVHNIGFIHPINLKNICQNVAFSALESFELYVNEKTSSTASVTGQTTSGSVSTAEFQQHPCCTHTILLIFLNSTLWLFKYQFWLGVSGLPQGQTFPILLSYIGYHQTNQFSCTQPPCPHN